MLTLFVSYWVSITMLCHVHVVDGVTIVHSHPFQTGTNHHHSNSNIQAISILAHFVADDTQPKPFCAKRMDFEICELEYELSNRSYHSPYHGVTALRAPPAA